MAYLLTSASSQCFTGLSAPVTVEPLTIALRFRPASSLDGQCVFQLASSTLAARYQISANVATSSVLVIKTADSGAQAISTNSFSFTVGQWVHIAAVFASTTSSIGYINGTAGTLNTTSILTATCNRMHVGARNGTGQFTNGDVAEIGVWNAALTAEEIAGLANGFPCRLARPSSLRFYSRLIRNPMDLSGGITLTNTNGATVSNHPRIIYPC
jgi:hypothetical protein